MRAVSSGLTMMVTSLIVACAGLSGCSDNAKAPAPNKTPSAAPAPVAKADALPAECESYIRTVTACVEKAGAGNPAIASFKQQMDTNRAEWAKVADKSSFAASCKQMEESFKATAAPALKC